MRQSMSHNANMMQQTFTRISDILDDAERAGRLDLQGKEVAAAMPGISRHALRRALHRQQARGRLLRTAHSELQGNA